MTEFEASKYEIMSSFMQPFLISPIINFSDIFCELALMLDKNPKYKISLLENTQKLENSKMDSPFLSIIYETLRLKHPFPMLERETTHDITDGKTFIPKGTHVFIELDSFTQNQNFQPENWSNQEYFKENSWMLFATGPRMCAGRLIAIQALETLLKELVIIKKGNFK